jgi:hypothetical protein
LLFSESELANAAFKEAQNQDPSYQRGWVGQSLLAEVTEGFEDEAMDLLRHATFLGNEVESSAGYAKWVCRLGKNTISLEKCFLTSFSFQNSCRSRVRQTPQPLHPLAHARRDRGR